MKPDHQNVPPPACGVALDEAAVCDDCGRTGAYRVGTHSLCLDCYSNKGSCCPEFGRDDLETFPDEDKRSCAGATRAEGRLRGQLL